MAKHWKITNNSNGKIVSYGDGDSYVYNFPSNSAVTNYDIIIRDESGKTGEISAYRIKKTSIIPCTALSANTSYPTSLSTTSGQKFYIQNGGVSDIIVGVITGRNSTNSATSMADFTVTNKPDWVTLALFPVSDNKQYIKAYISSNTGTTSRTSSAITIDPQCRDCGTLKLVFSQPGTNTNRTVCSDVLINNSNIVVNSSEQSKKVIGLVAAPTVSKVSFTNVSGGDWCTLMFQNTSTSAADYGVISFSAKTNPSSENRSFSCNILLQPAQAAPIYCTTLGIIQNGTGSCTCNSFTPISSYVDVPISGGTVNVGTIGAACNNFTATKPSWVTSVNNVSGVLKITAEENTTSDMRQGNFTLSVNDESCSDKTISLVQQAKCGCDSIRIGINTVSFPTSGGMSTSFGGIKTTGPCASSISVTATTPSWLKFVKSGTSFYLSASTNSSSSRSGNAVITVNGTQCATIYANQDGAACTCSSLNITTSSLIIDDYHGGGGAVGTIPNTCDFDVVSKPDWISVAYSPNGSNYIIVLTTNGLNESHSTRSGVVTFSVNGTACPAHQISVEQAGRPCSCNDITLSHTAFNFAYTGETFTAGTIPSACELNTVQKPQWLTISRSGNNIVITAAANTTSTSRSGTVILRVNNEDCTSKAFNVTQYGAYT